MAFAYGMGHGMGFGFGLGFLNLIGTVLFFAFLFWAFRSLGRGWRYGGRRGRGRRYGRSHGRPWEGGGDDAVKLAKERFAKGEISAEEFERIKAGLGEDEAETRSEARSGPPFEWFRDSDDALEIARKRLAKGELTLDEFETVKRALS